VKFIDDNFCSLGTGEQLLTESFF